MKPQQRQLLRLVAAIHQRYSQRRPADMAIIDLPEELWSLCGNSIRRMQKAHRRGWLLAAARERTLLMNRMAQLQDELAIQMANLRNMMANLRTASGAELYHDLRSLEEEFETVLYSSPDKTLSAHTEPIRLDGVYLGPFEIRLDWQGLPDHHHYEVIATDPQPASSNEDVTHPHVSSRQLCEGDGTAAIRRALKEGRLADFFLIVANLLRTYNSSSPYVSLDDWEGVRCADCDTLVVGDDRYCCDKCEAAICADCSRSCEQCSDYFCYQCLDECVGCGGSVCRNCLWECGQCAKAFCESCLHDNQCNTCREQEKEEQDDIETTTGSVSAHAHTSI